MMNPNDFLEDDDELFAGFGEEDLRIYDDTLVERSQNARASASTSGEQKNREGSALCSQVGGGPGEVLYNGEEANGFHLAAGKTYIYPTNYPVRQYQSNIVHTALFKNTMVTLPTGLGKTFIAAVVMYNYYRWYPCGKVVFMAPTRPLVTQQIKACHNIMNIPISDTTEMTGVQNADLRKTLWKEKRVFFLTPQVLVNDLRSKVCPAELIKCVVVDEAHRAVKDYAYCQVIKLLQMVKEAEYRVLALSATPGSDINAVQQVIQNLQITAMEVRGEDSLDVAPYTHSRAIDTIVVSPSVEMLRVKDDFLQVYEKYARRLKEFKSLTSNISTLSKFQVLKALEKFRANPPRGLNPSVMGSLVCDFTVCMSLAHALELLQIYGLRAFYSYLSDENSEKCKAASSRLKNDEDLKKLLRKLKTALYPNSTQNLPYIWGHPKLEKLVSSLTDHFKNYEQKKLQTKAIIFCQYRVVVSEIVELLEKNKPHIRAAVFVGQSGGKEKGMPQAKQLQIMKEFREGKINCLVATSVAEEGLDIGDVDLIILMEAHKSPVRLVQRIGRTGRKRKGHCVVLLAKGKEEQKFHEAMATRKSYVSNITNSKAIKSTLCQFSPSMFPPNIKPEQQLVHICVSKLEPSPDKKQPKKQVDIRHCLTNDSPFLSEDEFNQVFQELGGKDVCMERIPGSKELWHRRFDRKMKLDELFDKKLVELSKTNDWNRDINRSFKLSSSVRSQHLTELLSKKCINFVNFTDEELEKLIEEPENDGQKLKDTKDEENERKSKKLKKDTKNIDIRSCMAAAAEKATKKMEIDEQPELNMRKSLKNVFDMKEIEQILYSDDISWAYDNTKMSNRIEKYMKPCSCKIPEFDLNSNFDFILEPGILKNFNITKFKDSNEPQIYPDEIEFYEIIKTPSDIVGIDDLFDDLSNSPLKENLEKTEILITSNCVNKLENTEILKTTNLEKLKHTEILKTSKELPSSDDIVGIDDLFQNSSDELKPDSHNEILTQSIDFDNKKHETTPDISISLHRPQDKVSLKSDFKNKSSNIKENLMDDVLYKKSDFKTKIVTNNFQLAVENQHETIPKISLISPQKPQDKDVFCSKSDFRSKIDKNKFHAVENQHETISLISPEKSQDKDVFGSKSDFRSKIDNNKFHAVEKQHETISLISPEKSQDKDVFGSKSDFQSRIVENQLETISLISPKRSQDKDVFGAKSDFKKNLSDIKKNLSDDVLYEKSDFKTTTNKFQLAVENLLESKTSQNYDSDGQPLVSSTPKTLNKGKTFKKNIKKDDHVWNIDDFLNDDDDIFENVEIPRSQNESTMYGVTQLTSMIMKDKQSKVDLNESTMLGVTQLTSMIMKDKKGANSFSEIKNSKFDEPSTSNCKKSDLFQFMSPEAASIKTLQNKTPDVFELTSPDVTSYKTPQNKTPDVFQFTSPVTSYKTPQNKTPDVFKFKLQSSSSLDVSPILKKSEIFQFKSPDAQSLPSSSPSPVKKPRIRNKKAHRFIEHEAEVSGEETVDDSDNSSLNDFDDSFIDDQSQANLTHAHYLKSIKSPIHGKYKIPAPRDNFLDVFSQQVEQDEYQNDSFCVDTEGEDETAEPSLLEVVERKLAQKKKKTKKVLQSSSGSPTPDFNIIKKRKRILDSDTDNDTTPKAKKTLKYESSVFPIFSKKKSNDEDEELQEVLKLSQVETTIDPEKLFQQEIQEAIRLSQIETSKPNFKNLPSTSRSLFSSEPPKPNIKSFKKQKKIVDSFKKV